jgi:nitrogen fixation protein NifB
MDFDSHPCFSAEARHRTGRIHLPVAPKCNVQCNFCNRKYDCVNETRPGVTSATLTPKQAVAYLDSVLERVKDLLVVGIAGPGDPFANPDETLETMRLVRARYPEKILCLASNGLGLSEHVDEIAAIGVSHVTVTLNAVDPKIGARIYAWVRFGPHVYRGEEGALVLLERQTDAISRLKKAGVAVKINTVVIPGINDGHVDAVAKYAAALGADVQNCIPLMHVEDTPFEGMPSPEPGAMQALRFEAGKHIRQMSHCARCRADAVGKIGEENPEEIERLLAAAAAVKPDADRPYVAVASREGLFVNQHLGEATEFWIYGLEGKKLSLVGMRHAPVPGGGDERWVELAETLSDCFAVLTSGCGKAPELILSRRDIAVYAMEGLIAEGALALLSGSEVPRALLRRAGSCGFGSSCGGTGLGCA